MAHNGSFYDIERDITGQAADVRLAVRRKHSRPKVAAFFAWSEQQLARIPGKGNLAKAFRYGLSRMPGFTLFLEDGRVAIDNNPAERAIRPIAMCESLYTPSSSICKHWKRAGVGYATRAALPGHRRFDGRSGQIFRTDLIGRSANDLLSGKDTGFDKAAYHVVRDT